MAVSRSAFIRWVSFLHLPEGGTTGVGPRHPGVEPDGLLEVGQGPVGLVLSEEQHPAAIHVGRGPIGCEANRLVEVGQGAVVLLPLVPQPSAHAKGIQVPAVPFDRVIEVGHGLVERDHLIAADPATPPVIGQGDQHAIAVERAPP